MIYLFYGSNKEDMREEAHVFLDGLLGKNPEANVERVYPEEFSDDKLDEFILSRGLFGEPYIIIMEGILGNDTAATLVLRKMGEVSSSQNTFIFLEDELPVEVAEVAKENAEEIFYFKNKTEGKDVPKFNIWSLTDAFGRRDRKSAWILYQKAVLAGVTPEELHSMLFWQTKNILLAKKWGDGGAPSVGMKPFVFSKAKSFARNWSDRQITELSSKFIDVYHKSRKGLGSFEEALEKLILEI